MITRLEIENFKAIRKVAIDLTPLTVFIGPNDAGKTTILQALEVLSRSVDLPVFQPGQPSVFDRDPTEYQIDQRRTENVSLTASGTTSRNDRFEYCLVLGWRGEQFLAQRELLHVNGGVSLDVHHSARPSLGGNPEPSVAAVAAELRSFYVAFDPSRLAAPSAPTAELASSGAGLPGVIKRLLTSLDRGPLEKFETQLRRMSRFVRSVATRSLPSGDEELWYSLGDGKGSSAREASTGLLFVTAYLALRYGTAHRRFLIEEPENGVHPHAMLSIVDVLREIVATGGQVIATTHSPILVSFLEREDVQLVRRTAHGVDVTPILNTKWFNEKTQDVDLGELWYMVGDDELASRAV